jgi:hypothetical protein
MKANGEDLSNYHSPYEIKDVPQAYKSWIKAEHDKIIKASQRGTLSYALRDNKKYWINQFSKAEQKKMGIVSDAKLSIKERAAMRHAKRTSVEKADIQSRWDARHDSLRHLGSKMGRKSRKEAKIS